MYPPNTTSVTEIALPTVFTVDLEYNEDYSLLLRQQNIDFVHHGPYLEVGGQDRQGWILDIPVIVTQFNSLIKCLIPFLLTHKISFKIPENADAAVRLLSAHFGYENLGKVIVMHVGEGALANMIAQQLIRITEKLTGPDVPTDTHIGGLVYVRHSNTMEIPFLYPIGIAWPFLSIAKPKRKKPRKIFGRKFLAYEIIKPDVKGAVIKGLTLNKAWKLQFNWCLIKEGKKAMSLDGDGRTIKDRLVWQQNLLLKLSDLLKVPKVYDYFEEHGDCYLVMEYIEGILFHDFLKRRFADRSWPSLPISDKKVIIEYFMGISKSVAKMHSAGYIHRDLTPPNFVIGNNGELYFIDLELCYQKDYFGASSPFSYGTPGFMSPEQADCKTPTFKEDIYGLGALMICCFTGLNPNKFQISDRLTLQRHLNYFIRDIQLTELIISCLSASPDDRPELEDLINEVERFSSRALAAKSDKMDLSFSKKEIDAIVHLHIPAYKAGNLAAENRLWFSRPDDRYNQVVNPSIQKVYHAGFYSGTTGTLYFIALLKRLGFDLTGIRDEIESNYQFASGYYKTFPGENSSLYNGSAGMALTLNECLKSEMVPSTTENLHFLTELLSTRPDHHTISIGIAGWGLTLISCQPFLEQPFFSQALQSAIRLIVEDQKKDGSWSTAVGFSNGTAGIVYFLLKYYDISKDGSALNAALNGLNWLEKQRIRIGINSTWALNDKTNTVDPFLDNGVAGVALVFIKAYQSLADNRFRSIAKSALLALPEQLISADLTLLTGITGVGKVYLEAYRIFGDEQWKDRATFICGAIMNSFLQTDSDGTPIWLGINNRMATADLLSGNAGICSFLLDYAYRDFATDNFLNQIF
jgi:serine/threonine protein kinase